MHFWSLFELFQDFPGFPLLNEYLIIIWALFMDSYTYTYQIEWDFFRLKTADKDNKCCKFRRPCVTQTSMVAI